MRVLVTGSHGFIGGHVARHLAARGHEVLEFEGDVSSPDDWLRAPRDLDAVAHLAARVGTGESMYRIGDYARANVAGTACMLDALDYLGTRRVVLASSSAVYGSSWAPLTERSAVDPQSVYAVTKLAQENLVRLATADRAILRLFCVYGPGQDLSSPYSGIVGILSARLMEDRPPILFEDGRQTRDLLYVDDAARAFVMALEEDWEGCFVIGTGYPTSLAELVTKLRHRLGGPEPTVLGERRAGDARHAVSCPSHANAYGWQHEIGAETGLDRFCAWASENPSPSGQDLAVRELRERGLTVRR